MHETTSENNRIRLETLDGEPVAYIPLTQGFEAILDADKLHLVPGSWFYSKGYAVQHRDGKNIPMHRVLLGIVGRKTDVDHINGNTLDNRLSQLRLCTRRQNLWNQPREGSNTSGYKGVHWDRSHLKWCARIRTRKGRIQLGRFDTRLEAARAYDEAARKYHGPFARTNFREDEPNRSWLAIPKATSSQQKANTDRESTQARIQDYLVRRYRSRLHEGPD